ncbi:hypothetical protein GCM10010330_01470 [Streptomyces tendae]|nr:hypothetical protein GCM10010330_01470 [Streptomyces tendae]
MSQLTGLNKHGKTGISLNCASTGRGRRRLRVSSGEVREASGEREAGKAAAVPAGHACEPVRKGAGACVDRVTFSKCGPLGGVVGSSVAASAPSVLRVRLLFFSGPLAMSLEICSYHLIKNIPFMIRYRPACNRGR